MILPGIEQVTKVFQRAESDHLLQEVRGTAWSWSATSARVSFLLQGQDVAAVHHEVRGERVAEHMRFLPTREGDTGHFHGEVEAVAAVGELAVAAQVRLQALFQFWRYRDRATTL